MGKDHMISTASTSSTGEAGPRHGGGVTSRRPGHRAGQEMQKAAATHGGGLSLLEAQASTLGRAWRRERRLPGRYRGREGARNAQLRTARGAVAGQAFILRPTASRAFAPLSSPPLEGFSLTSKFPEIEEALEIIAAIEQVQLWHEHGHSTLRLAGPQYDVHHRDPQ